MKDDRMVRLADGTLVSVSYLCKNAQVAEYIFKLICENDDSDAEVVIEKVKEFILSSNNFKDVKNKLNAAISLTESLIKEIENVFKNIKL